MDMSAFVIPKSDQMNADDLISGPRTITITKVVGTNNAEQPVAVFFEGDNSKPYKPGKSMRRVMVAAWGIQTQEYVGRSMTLYCDPTVVFGGMQVGGIRISHMSDIDRDLTLLLTTTKSKRKPFEVKRLVASAPKTSRRDALYAAARVAAGRGSHSLYEFTTSLQPAALAALTDIGDELKRAAASSDAAKEIPDHDLETGEIGDADPAENERDYSHDDDRI